MIRVKGLQFTSQQKKGHKEPFQNFKILPSSGKVVKVVGSVDAKVVNKVVVVVDLVVVVVVVVVDVVVVVKGVVISVGVVVTKSIK